MKLFQKVSTVFKKMCLKGFDLTTKRYPIKFLSTAAILPNLLTAADISPISKIYPLSLIHTALMTVQTNENPHK